MFRGWLGGNLPGTLEPGVVQVHAGSPGLGAFPRAPRSSGPPPAAQRAPSPTAAVDRLLAWFRPGSRCCAHSPGSGRTRGLSVTEEVLETACSLCPGSNVLGGTGVTICPPSPRSHAGPVPLEQLPRRPPLTRGAPSRDLATSQVPKCPGRSLVLVLACDLPAPLSPPTRPPENVSFLSYVSLSSRKPSWIPQASNLPPTAPLHPASYGLMSAGVSGNGMERFL